MGMMEFSGVFSEWATDVKKSQRNFTPWFYDSLSFVTSMQATMIWLLMGTFLTLTEMYLFENGSIKF